MTLDERIDAWIANHPDPKAAREAILAVRDYQRQASRFRKLMNGGAQ